MSNMHVLLLATNEHPKLRPLTDSLAASMVPIVNRPVMALAIETLARAGYKDLFVSLYQSGGSIASYFGEGRRWGVQIEYLTQREALGSAGAVRWASDLLKETVLVLPAEMILDLDVEQALADHRAQGAKVTLIVKARSQPVTHPVALNASGRVSGLGEHALAGDCFEFTGAFLCEPDILDTIAARINYDTYTQWLPLLLQAGVAVAAHQTGGYWNPLSSFQEYQEAQRVYLYSAYAPETPELQMAGDLPRVRFPSIEGQQIAPGIWVGPNHMIHPSARLAPPLCIGEGCSIGRDAELGPDVVLGSNVVIEDEATVQSSTILRKTYVGQLVNINRRVINQTLMIDTQTSESIQVVDAFLLAPVTRAAISTGWLERARTFILAFILLVAALPLMLVAYILSVLASGSFVLARAQRVGRRAADLRGVGEAQTFGLLAFQTRRKDGTQTSLGRWLHRWQLDRLPELWNVLQGDLALVGVKPLTQPEAAYLHEAWHFKRYDSPAGLTGLWYVQSPQDDNFDSTLIADAYYAATHTWRYDVQLLLQTPRVWLQRAGSVHERPVNSGDYYGHADKISGI
jgi:NDP-sugar pyrophosphorylase family protein